MRLKTIELNNWGPHSHFAAPFADGLTAILGPNGSGKSSILEGIRWLLTGDTPDTKAENIFQLAPVTDRSNGRLVFSHQQVTYEVTRHLRPDDRATLFADGASAAVGEKAVTAKLTEVLQVDAKMLNRYVLIKQGEMLGFLAEDPAVRAAALQRLFNTDKAAVVCTAGQKHLNKLTIPQVSSQLDATRANVVQLTARQAAVEAELLLYPEMPDFAQLQTASQRVLTEYQLRESLESQRNELMQKMSIDGPKLAEAEVQLAQRVEDIHILELAITAGEQEMQTARIRLANWHTHQRLEQARTALQRQREQLQQSMAADIAPEHPVHPTIPGWPAITYRTPPATQSGAIAQQPYALLCIGDRSLVEVHQELAAQVSRKMQLIKQFDGTGVAECPTCLTPTTNLSHVVQVAKADLPGLQQIVGTLHLYLAEVNHYDIRQREWQQRQRHYQVTKANLETQEAQLGQAGVPLESAEQYTTKIDEHQAYVDAVTEMRPAMTQLQSLVASLKGTREAQEAQMLDLTQRLSHLQVFPEQAAAARQEIMARAQQRENRDQRLYELAQVQAYLEAGRSQLQSLEAQNRQALTVQDWIGRAEHVRAVLHHDAAPKFVAQAKLQELESMINDLLRVFNLPYTVAATQGLTFQANYFDGRRTPAKRLSWGQRIALAWAFMITVNAMFADWLGFLAFDEPTAYLDKERIRSLVPVLEQLRAVAAARGLQCLMITHEDELRPQFDAVITL